MEPQAIETFEVQIAGLPLRLRSSHDLETVQELIALVDDKVQTALNGNPNISFQKALLLATLHIAEDLLFLKRAAVDQLDTLEQRAKDILSALESTPANRVRLDN